MKKETLIEKLKKLEHGDEEINHSNADDLLLEFIDIPQVTEAFNKIDKWYA